MSVPKPFWRGRLLPAAFVLLGLNLVALAGWTGPRYWMQRNAATRVEAARRELARERRATATLRERAASIRGNEAYVDRFYRSLAGSERADLLPTLKAIEDMAGSPGLRPGSRTFQRAEVKDARVERVVVTLPLAGTYEQLVGFLREVETSPRFLTVDRVSMRAENEGGARLQVELSTYLRPRPEGGEEDRRGR